MATIELATVNNGMHDGREVCAYGCLVTGDKIHDRTFSFSSIPQPHLLPTSTGLTTLSLSGAGHHPDLLILSVPASLLESFLPGLATLGLAFLTASLLCLIDCDLDFDLRAFDLQHLRSIPPRLQL